MSSKVTKMAIKGYLRELEVDFVGTFRINNTPIYMVLVNDPVQILFNNIIFQVLQQKGSRM